MIKVPAMKNPFRSNFESLSGPPNPVVDHLHEAALHRLQDLAEDDEGALILLRAPRGGYGKTMLISRLRTKTAERVTMVPIGLAAASGFNDESTLETFLAAMTGTDPEVGALSRLDLITRRLFALGLIPLVQSGEVPSQDVEGALSSLRESPERVFDFHDEGASVAQWTKGQFKTLSPKFVSAIASQAGASANDVSCWLNVLFRFSTCPPGETGRLGELMDSVFGEMSRFRTGTGYSGAFVSFLKMVTLAEKLVVILDEADGLFGNGDLALKVASHLISIRQAVPSIKIVISVNDDVWESAFLPSLPTGMKDRLEDSEIRLGALDERGVVDLLKARAGGDGERIFRELELGGQEHYPRAVLRKARDVWEMIYRGGAATVTGDLGIGFSEVDIPPVSKPVWDEAPVKRKFPYPPKPVRRVSLPRKFVVERIREKAELVMPKIESPFKIAEPVSKAPSPSLPTLETPQATKPVRNPFAPKPVLPRSPEEASEKAESIQEMLRKFRTGRDS